MLALFADPFKRAAMQALSLPIAELITDSPAAAFADIHSVRPEIALLILTLVSSINLKCWNPTRRKGATPAFGDTDEIEGSISSSCAKSGDPPAFSKTRQGAKLNILSPAMAGSMYGARADARADAPDPRLCSLRHHTAAYLLA